MKAASILVLGLVLALGCAAERSSAHAEFDQLGHACDADHPCAGGTTCGTTSITLGQCILDCAASDDGTCPPGSFCTSLGGGAHACVRQCSDDTDCKTHTSNPAEVCNDATRDDGTQGPLVCTGE
jgi:hypothetical protein